jgi:predicted HicB family RNase H-like nuclease
VRQEDNSMTQVKGRIERKYKRLLKIKLAQEDQSFNTWLRQKILDYIEEKKT